MQTDERLGKCQSTKTMSHPSRDQSGERHGRDAFRRLVWLIPTAALIVAMGIGLTIKALDDYSNENARAELVLAEFEEDAAQQHLAGIEAVEEGEAPRTNTDQIDENRRELVEQLEELERLGVIDEQIARVREAQSAVEAAMDEELRLTGVGQPEEAEAAHVEQVDTGFEELDEITGEVGAELEEDSERAYFLVEIGTFAVPLLAALATTAVCLYYRRKIMANRRVLEQSEERFRSFIETTQEWIWSIDLQGRHTYANPAVENILGYRPEEILGKNRLTLMHEEDRKAVEGELLELIAQKRGWNGLVLRWRHKDGGYRYLESNAVPLIDESSELVGYRALIRMVEPPPHYALRGE